MNTKITSELKDKIKDYLEGTCMLPGAALYKFDLNCDDDEIVDIMLDFNLELCPTCGWWCECHERIPDERHPGADGITPDDYCENCRPNPPDTDD